MLKRSILLVNTAGPPGARHASASLLLLACDLSDPSISFRRIVVGSHRHARDHQLSSQVSANFHTRVESDRVSRPISGAGLASMRYPALRSPLSAGKRSGRARGSSRNMFAFGSRLVAINESANQWRSRATRPQALA